MPLPNFTFKLIKSILPAAVFAAALGFSLPANAQLSGVMTAETFSQLMSVAEDRGVVRVIVGLDVPTTVEGDLTDDQVASQQAMIASAQGVLAGTFGADTVVRNFQSVPYSALSVTAAQLETLQTMTGITSVVEDTLAAPTLDVSTRVINAHRMWNRGFDGTGYSVAVLDTGISYQNQAFLPRPSVIANSSCFSTTSAAFGSTSACNGGVASDVGRQSAPAASLAIDGAGHGTHVAGIVASRAPQALRGVAHDARLVPIQVFSIFSVASGYCSGGIECMLSWSSDQMAGLDRVNVWVNRYGIASVNMSLGGGQYFATCDSSNPGYAAIVTNLRSRGVAVVVSSGNNGYTTSTGAPGCYSGATTVGATDDVDNIASFSNQATAIVNLMAPGVGIRAAYPAFRRTTAGLSGTSMAAPHVAGAFAIMREIWPTATVDQLETVLRCTGTAVTRAGTPGTFYRIDLLIAWQYARNQIVPSC